LVFKGGGLHTSEKKDGKWTEPVRIDEISNRFGWVGVAQITNDGGVMLFEAKKGSDNIDFYVTFRQEDGKWGVPVRLPDNVNTDEDDRSPSLYLDGKVMYFSTSGHEGFGKMDVFKTTRLDDTWTKWSDPVNLGRAINTADDEWGFNFAVASDGKTAFFAKQNGELHDLMMTELPVNMRISPMKMIQVPIKSVNVTYVEVRNSAGELIQSIRVKPGSEEIFISVPEENWDEKITITPKTGDDVITTPVTIDMKKPTAVLDTIVAIPVRNYIESKENFKIGAVQFDLAESELRPEAKEALDKFCKALATQKVSIFITGHTDDNGSEADNQVLSEKRVAAVKAYMVSRGIPEKSITATGMGETAPKVPNTSDRNRAVNRRVEFRFPLIAVGSGRICA
ncbi:MAG: OmpA family protein, partial [Bacteroidota bacterium]